MWVQIKPLRYLLVMFLFISLSLLAGNLQAQTLESQSDHSTGKEAIDKLDTGLAAYGGSSYVTSVSRLVLNQFKGKRLNVRLLITAASFLALLTFLSHLAKKAATGLYIPDNETKHFIQLEKLLRSRIIAITSIITFIFVFAMSLEFLLIFSANTEKEMADYGNLFINFDRYEGYVYGLGGIAVAATYIIYIGKCARHWGGLFALSIVIPSAIIMLSVGTVSALIASILAFAVIVLFYISIALLIISAVLLAVSFVLKAFLAGRTSSVAASVGSLIDPKPSAQDIEWQAYHKGRREKEAEIERGW
ncbi:MAG: hypothetical protein HQL44_15220 [Alphaproteobacteria bacterium]|nr:hypothetical protein [Alphaproteobacteria bacterium]